MSTFFCYYFLFCRRYSTSYRVSFKNLYFVRSC